MEETTTATTATPKAGTTSTTSLNAYAAWLAKHETKAARKRNVDVVETTESTAEEGIDDRIQKEDVEDPYLQWLRRKETKLPLVKIVVASPDRVEKAPPVNTSALIGSDIVDQDKQKETTRNGSKTAHSLANKGKKRVAASDPTESSSLHTEKKAKTVAFVAPISASPPHLSPADVSKPKATARTSSTSTNVKLPMLEEVRYWQNVDRFSFLS